MGRTQQQHRYQEEQHKTTHLQMENTLQYFLINFVQ